MWVLCGTAIALLLLVHQVRGQGFARPWLGVVMSGDAGRGVLVGHVVRGSPADRAGIRAGDRITRVASRAVANGNEVIRAVGDYHAGSALDITFVRGGAERDTQVTLAPLPAPDELLRMDLVGTFAPAWRGVRGIAGAFPASLAALRGRVVLLDFWATWCGPCRIVAPKLSALQDRYGAQGLSVVGVAADDPQDIARFATRLPVSYPLAADLEGETSRDYGISSLPTLLVIDKRGVVREVAVGYDPAEDAWLDGQVRSLLAEPAPQ
jgi:thiol-disulfide isomerase/thioredoxin